MGKGYQNIALVVLRIDVESKILSTLLDFIVLMVLKKVATKAKSMHLPLSERQSNFFNDKITVFGTWAQKREKLSSA